MKKLIKRTAMTLTVLLALFGITTGVAFASGYIQWNGSSDYFQLIENLDLISQRGHEMKADNENINRELEQTNNRLLDKENDINALEQEIESLKKQAEGNNRNIKEHGFYQGNAETFVLAHAQEQVR